MDMPTGVTRNSGKPLHVPLPGIDAAACCRWPQQGPWNLHVDKTLAFLHAASTQHKSDYILKLDHNVYFRKDRLPFAIQQWRRGKAGNVPLYQPQVLALVQFWRKWCMGMAS